MGPIPKPSDDDKAYFASLFEHRPDVELKPMFGNLAAFSVNNAQMCAGLFGPLVGIRLDEAQREELLAVKGAGPFGPEDRPMKEYVSLPPSWRTGHDDEVDAWIDTAVAHTATLPAKKKKAKKA